LDKEAVWGYVILVGVALVFWWKYILFVIAYVVATVLLVAYFDQSKEALKEKETLEEKKKTPWAKLVNFATPRKVIVVAIVCFLAHTLFWWSGGLASLRFAKVADIDTSINLGDVHVQRENVEFSVAEHQLNVPAKESIMGFKMDTFRGAPSPYTCALSEQLKVVVIPRFGADLTSISGGPYEGWHRSYAGICNYEVVISDREKAARIARFVITNNGMIARHPSDFPWPPSRTGGRAKFVGGREERQWDGNSKVLKDRRSRSTIQIDLRPGRLDTAKSSFASGKSTTAVELKFPTGILQFSVKPL